MQLFSSSFSSSFSLVKWLSDIKYWNRESQDPDINMLEHNSEQNSERVDEQASDHNCEQNSEQNNEENREQNFEQNDREYRVIQNLTPPAREELAKPCEKLTLLL